MFDGPTCKIVSKSNSVAAEGTRNGNLYILQGLSVIDETVEYANVAKVESRELWHQRLAHIGDRALDKMSTGEFAKGVNLNKMKSVMFVKVVLKVKVPALPQSQLMK